MVKTAFLLLLFHATFFCAFGLDSDVIEELDDGHSSSGVILKKQDGRTETSSAGGKVFFVRSHNRARASAVRTFDAVYVGGDRTPQIHPVNHRDDHYEHDLHTAYRLPLQRLSDRQLSALLTRYTPEGQRRKTRPQDRVEMIIKVQEMIVQNSKRKLLRPTLLTNINMLPEDVAIDSEPVANPKTHQRTTLHSVPMTTPVPVTIRKPDIRRSQKQIPEIETVHRPIPSPQSGNNRLNQINKTLRQVKARYNAAKFDYLRRLRALNERKITLALPHQVKATKHVIHTSESRYLTPAHQSPLIDSDSLPAPEPHTASRVSTTNQKFTMADALRNIIFMAREKQLKLHEGGANEEVQTAAPEKIIPPRATAPRASPIPKIHAVNTKVDVQEPIKSAEIEINSQLHFGGDEPAEQVTSTKIETRVEEHQENGESADKKTFSFNMKKVSDITTTDLISQLNDELKVESASAPTILDNEKTTAEVEVLETTTQVSTTEQVLETESVTDATQNEEQRPVIDQDSVQTLHGAKLVDNEEETPVNEQEKETATTAKTPESAAATEETTATPKADDETVVSSDDEDDLAAFAAETDEEAICDAISCNFEKGDLCQWEASKDELSPDSRHYRHARSTRFIRRTWHNWQGRYRNRVTGIARAQIFSFENKRFAAAYVRPLQRATLTGKLLSGEQETLRFRAWEATRDVQLKMCCDTTENCVFETEIGVRRGSRRWREHVATCPAGTSKVIFECINHGIYQGACGLDNIHLVNLYCPQVIPLTSVVDNGRRF